MSSPYTRSYIDPTKVALFITSPEPFDDEWVAAQCRIAEQAAICREGLEPIRLERIAGHFDNWTPFQLARDYVYPRLYETPSPFAYVSVVLDDKSHDDKLVMIVGVHPDSFKGAPMEVEATTRVGAEYAVDLPIIFHEGHQAITSYPCEEYDNEAEQ